MMGSSSSPAGAPVRRLLLCALLAACGTAPPGRPAPAERSGSVVLEAMARVDRSSALSLWPGFEPASVPVALFDGRRTLLFRHPAPPAGFVSVEGMPGVMEHPGQHPAVRANTAAELNGVPTATVLLADTAALAPEALAGLVVHEAFHVFRELRHPDWVGNEVEMFTYPVDDRGVLSARRLEDEALRRALGAASADSAACWARAALDLRARRYATVSEGAAAYERGTELNEGLARYVERRVAPAGDAEPVVPADLPPAAVRERSYATGHALALLLDRLAPSWKDELEAGSLRSLDEALRTALGSGGPARCAFAAEQLRAADERSALDVERYRRELAERRDAFVSADGWSIDVVAGPEPLWPQRFDPLNVHRVAPGEVLHTRWIRLGNASGSVEVLGRTALSEAAGEHPLFNGVRRLVVTGLAVAPTARDSAGVVILEGDGVAARLRGSATWGDRTLTVRLAAR